MQLWQLRKPLFLSHQPGIHQDYQQTVLRSWHGWVRNGSPVEECEGNNKHSRRQQTDGLRQADNNGAFRAPQLVSLLTNTLTNPHTTHLSLTTNVLHLNDPDGRSGPLSLLSFAIIPMYSTKLMLLWIVHCAGSMRMLLVHRNL